MHTALFLFDSALLLGGYAMDASDIPATYLLPML
jgi:hypothetical protein